MKSINIKGKDYIPVNERLKEFRVQHPSFSLQTEVVELTAEWCVLKAVIKDETGRIIAEGMAFEDRNSKFSMVNKTSYVENCETSAWGRALANLGIGIDASIASATEVAVAIVNQGMPEQTPHGPETSEAVFDQLITTLDACESEAEVTKLVTTDTVKKQVAYLKKNAPELYEEAFAHKNHVMNKLQIGG